MNFSVKHIISNFLILFASFALGSKARATEGIVCSNTFSGAGESSTLGSPRKDMAILFTFLESAELNKTKLSWEDFNLLEKATLAFQLNREKIETSSDYKAIFISELKKLENEKKGAFNKNEAGLSAEVLSNLPLSQFGLMNSYRSKLNRLLSLLPTPLNKLLPSFPFNNKKEVFVMKAVEAMAKQSQRFEQIFATTGFSDVQEFETHIKSNESENQKEMEYLRDEIEALNKNEFEFAMRRPEGARFWLTNGAGFQNQRETGSSNGYLHPDLRDEAEANGLGIPKEIYAALDNDFKPVYGYLSPSINTLMLYPHFEVTRYYGSDIYYFKKEIVKARISFMHDDSIRRLQYSGGKWDTAFIPWTFRSLISPAQILASGRGALTPIDFDIKSLKVSGSQYIELQFWGPIGLEDVDKMTFEGTPPSGEYLDILKQLNIKIYDGRTKPIKLWDGKS